MKKAKKFSKPTRFSWQFSFTPKDNIIDTPTGKSYKEYPFGDRRAGFLWARSSPNIVICGEKQSIYNKCNQTMNIGTEELSIISGQFRTHSLDIVMRRKRIKK